jgi:hypothetical protein
LPFALSLDMVCDTDRHRPPAGLFFAGTGAAGTILTALTLTDHRPGVIGTAVARLGTGDDD